MANVFGEILGAAQNGLISDIGTAIDQASGNGQDTTSDSSSPAQSSALDTISSVFQNIANAASTIGNNATVQQLIGQAETKSAPAAPARSASPTVNKAVAAVSSPTGISTIALVIVAVVLILRR